jgi:glycerate 2-kinase
VAATAGIDQVSDAARRLILDAFDAALAAASPSEAVKRTIRRIPTGEFEIAGDAFPPGSSFEVIALGKAAPAMAIGACAAIGREGIRRGFVLTTEGQEQVLLGDQFEWHVGSHPVLDERSVQATQRLIEWLDGVDPGAIAVCLISGGGSALLEAPVDGVSLTDFQETTRLLLRAGADIYQMNAVRTHISRVKGGGLRAMIPARKVVTLVLSDVLGNDLGVIASGPTVPSVSGPDKARQVIAELGLEAELPASVRHALIEARRPACEMPADDVVSIVADNQTALHAAREFLEDKGLDVRVLPDARTGEARLAARKWVASLANTDDDAVIAGGELTVTVGGDGTGGRNSEFALAAAQELETRGLTEWTVASLATDGQDAETGAAGAVVDSRVPARLRSISVDPEFALAQNDTFPGLDGIGAAVVTGPTGTNVNDLYFALRNSSG